MIVYNMYREGDVTSFRYFMLCIYLRLTVLFNKAGSLHTDWDIARNIYIKYRLFILMNNLVLLLTTIYYMVSDNNGSAFTAT